MDILIYEGTSTYTTKGGKVVSCDLSGFMELEDDLVRDYRVYMDPGALTGALQEEG